MSTAPITFEHGKLPNGWPQPTFMSIHEDGTFGIEWCFGKSGTPDTWRVSFFWDPDPEVGTQIIKTTRSDSISFCTTEGFDPKQIGPTLDSWLRTDSAQHGGDRG